MFGELIVVEEQLVDLVVTEVNPSEGRESSAWRQLNEFHLVSLWRLLDSSKSDEECLSELKILSANEGETWVVVVPNSFRDLLVKRAKVDNLSLIKDWAATEEFKWGWKQADVSSLFSDIVRLASYAQKVDETLVY